MNIYTSEFWAATGERALRTFAQTAAGLLAGDGLGILDIDWTSVLSVASLATIASVLMSVASSPIGTPGPALVTTETIGVRSAEAETWEAHPEVTGEPVEVEPELPEPVEMSDDEATEPIVYEPEH